MHTKLLKSSYNTAPSIMSCSFSFVNAATCGSKLKSDTIIPLLQCDNDITSLLVGLGVSESRGGSSSRITEKDLILNRAGFYKTSFTKEESMTICQGHRFYLTSQWPGVKRKQCSYPLHIGRKTVDSANPRRVTRRMSEDLFLVFNEKVPIGSGRFSFLQYFSVGGQLEHQFRHADKD